MYLKKIYSLGKIMKISNWLVKRYSSSGNEIFKKICCDSKSNQKIPKKSFLKILNLIPKNWIKEKKNRPKKLSSQKYIFLTIYLFFFLLLTVPDSFNQKYKSNIFPRIPKIWSLLDPVKYLNYSLVHELIYNDRLYLGVYIRWAGGCI